MSVVTTQPPSLVIPGLYPNRKGPRKLGSFESFLISALAPAIAVLFTNPFDTIKVRLQLQGQSGSGVVQYKNSFDALQKIFLVEGIKGLQKGLTPAILREGSKNVFRIGMFDPIMTTIHNPKQGRAPAWKRIAAGSICGVMGAVACNPFELVKTRLQSAASGKMAVGHQHGYTGVFSAIKTIYTQEGIAGLYRGSWLSVGRSTVGSGANLSVYSLMKEHLSTERKWSDGAMLDMVCGLSSGVVSCIFMNPIDVVRTRYYNQPYINGKGAFYSSGFEAVKQISKKEGPQAFYKGFLSHFLRIGPHFCLTFVFLGILRRNTASLYEFLDRRETFNAFDCDGDGKLNQNEIEAALATVFKPLSDKAPDSKSLHQYTTNIISHSNSGTITFDEYAGMEKFVKEIYKKRMLGNTL